VVNLFFEPSTRTRTSFEVAEKRLSADTLNVAIATSSVVKGETLVDTALNLEAMSPDMIVLRHAASGACHLLSRICRSRIINAGDGMHEHPTQALLDAFTIRQHKLSPAQMLLERIDSGTVYTALTLDANRAFIGLCDIPPCTRFRVRGLYGTGESRASGT